MAVAWPPQLGMAAALAEEADARRHLAWPRPARARSHPPDSRPGRRRLPLPDPAASRPRWGAALAFPGSRTILLRADAGDPSRTLRHELAHLVLHERVRTRVPRWFDEGYAALAAGEWDRVCGALELNLSVARGGGARLSTSLDGALRGNVAAVAGVRAGHVGRGPSWRSGIPTGGPPPRSSTAHRRRDSPTPSVHATTGLSSPRFDAAWRRYRPAPVTGLMSWFAAGGALGSDRHAGSRAGRGAAAGRSAAPGRARRGVVLPPEDEDQPPRA